MVKYELGKWIGPGLETSDKTSCQLQKLHDFKRFLIVYMYLLFDVTQLKCFLKKTTIIYN